LNYLDLIGQPVEEVKPSRFDFRHIVLSRVLAVFGSIAAGLLTWAQLFRSYRPPVAFFDFDLKDRRLTLSTVIGLSKIVLYPVYRFLKPKR
jgi:hypothetical protein